MATTETRINAIKNKRMNIQINQSIENLQIVRENENAIAKIKSFQEDMQELMTLANELQSNGFCLGVKAYMTNCPTFITDWFYHGVGFYTAESNWHHANGLYTLQGFGIRNGGANGEVDVVIDWFGNIKSYGYVNDKGKMIDIIAFANGFPKFKENFLKWIDEKF